MGWDGPIMTDSGGFQVFSMGHGTVAEEIKGRARGRARRRSRGPRRSSGQPAARVTQAAVPAGERDGAILAIEEEGVRFRSYVDGRERFLSPEGSMATQAALGSDIALVFDECTPFHVDREYTQRSTERTHRWLERCLRWHARARTGETSSCTGSCRAASTRTCARESARTVAASGCDGIAIGGSLGAEKAQMYEVVG